MLHWTKHVDKFRADLGRQQLAMIRHITLDMSNAEDADVCCGEVGCRCSSCRPKDNLTVYTIMFPCLETVMVRAEPVYNGRHLMVYSEVMRKNMLLYWYFVRTVTVQGGLPLGKRYVARLERLGRLSQESITTVYEELDRVTKATTWTCKSHRSHEQVIKDRIGLLLIDFVESLEMLQEESDKLDEDIEDIDQFYGHKNVSKDMLLEAYDLCDELSVAQTS